MSSIRLKKNIVERKKKALIKIGILAAVLLILCMAVYLSVDRVAPTFDFTDAASVYSVNDGAELDISTFLKGVRASDNVDGDLTERIAIKSMRQNADASISVIYCVRDNSGNLTIEERIYNLNVTGGNSSSSGNDVAKLPEDAQTSAQEPDTTDDAQNPADPAESQPEETVDVPAEPDTPQETEPQDTPAVVQPEETEPAPETEPQEAETKSAKPVITLNATEAHVAVGEGFYYPGYIAEMWDDVDDQTQLYNSIWIENYELVDWNTPGVYTLIFRVVDSDKNISDGQPFTLYVE